MTEPPLPTVVCNFRNEEVYLRYWLRHHGPLFGHGVLLDYHSTDGARAVARELAPTWEFRTNRDALFDSAAVDAEVADVERGLSGWKVCLNATEFLVHHDLRAYLADLERARPGTPGWSPPGTSSRTHRTRSGPRWTRTGRCGSSGTSGSRSRTR